MLRIVLWYEFSVMYQPVFANETLILTFHERITLYMSCFIYLDKLRSFQLNNNTLCRNYLSAAYLVQIANEPEIKNIIILIIHVFLLISLCDAGHQQHAASFVKQTSLVLSRSRL